MKVKVSFTVEIDPELWELNFGISDRKEIREDVKVFAENIVNQQLIVSGCKEE